MWLSEMAGRSLYEPEPPVQTGRVSIGGESPAVLTGGETRKIRVLAPGGLSWLPAAGQNVLVLRADDGALYLAGAELPENPGIGNGELALSSADGLAKITLRSGGSIDISGNLNVRGVVRITGALYLNGLSIQP